MVQGSFDVAVVEVDADVVEGGLATAELVVVDCPAEAACSVLEVELLPQPPSRTTAATVASETGMQPFMSVWNSGWVKHRSSGQRGRLSRP
jgi:hypothetical protein